MSYKKLLLVIIIMGFISLSFISLTSALTVTQVFSDGLEVDTFATTWTGDGSPQFSRVTSGTIYQGAAAILANGGTANELLTLTNGLNITNQTNCTLTAVIQIHSNLDGGEYLCMDYSTDNGTTWNQDTGSDGGVGGLCQDGGVDTETAWRNVSQNISSATGITSFKIRFRLNTNNANEDGYIDDINLTCSKNEAPVISNITASHTVIKGGNTLTIFANTTTHGVNDTEADTLFLYCDNSTTPNSTNTDCTGGAISDSTYPYALTCTFATSITNTNYTEYCRVYDGISYSSIVPNITYTTDSTPPTTSIVSVAGDTIASYYDTVNDGLTNITISGEASMLCRWSSSDIVYSSMTNDCEVGGTQANCSINDVVSQGFHTKYISCQDNYTNSQNTSQNLDISFFLDYTAPTTTDNSVSVIQIPNYTITITEADNVDSDPTSFYCTSANQGCNPLTSIDNGGTITYTPANRGANYLRYYSVDDANNTQTIVNKTININQLPVLISAVDDAVTIKGEATVNVSTVSNDSDSGQEITLRVCNSSGANLSDCSGGTYCNTTGTSNLSCTFVSETDSASHTWYAYIFDELGEAASNNSITGSYTTDSTNPIITLVTPANASVMTQNSATFRISLNEALTNAWYSLNGGNNITMTNTSLLVYIHANTSIADGIYNMTFWANDSYGNIETLIGNYFTINTTTPDTTAPEISIWSPINNTYYTSAAVLLNMTSDESLSWAGYKINSGSLTTLDNVSTTSWNATYTFTEGQDNITFYANDSSNNQANSTIGIWIDLTNPSVNAFSCTDANDSQNVICSANVSDSIGLNYAIIGYNATGSFQNSSQISLSGNSSSLNYTIAAGNTTPGSFTAQIYLYDLSGRTNLTSSYGVLISDDTFPEIYNITYYPNTTNLLDPGTRVNINATIIEDYNISTVVLMYRNSSIANWTSVNMTNLTAITYSGATNTIYNASFVPQNETWYFKINATDTAGNQNVSSTYTLIVENDISQNITTNIPAIKSVTYAQRTDNNSLGNLIMNNTGDGILNFNVSLSSTNSNIQNRLSINYTGNQTANFSATSGNNVNITLDVNTTDLITGLYDYNITVRSEAGTDILEKNLNVQTADGAYLSVSIDTYSSSVTTSQTGVTYAVSVTNLGTADATGVYLNWTLPSIFNLASGNLSRSLGTIPIGGSGTNTITVDVASSTADITYYINATATASNADSATTFKSITVSNPITITPTTTTTTTGGGGGGAAKSEAIVYKKTVEIVRGGKQDFNIEIFNKYANSNLKDLTIKLSGYPEQYIKISPEKINQIDSGERANFVVSVEVPSYKGYEEHDLKAIITGEKITNGQSSIYTEIQYIKLIVQEIAYSETQISLSEAEKAIKEMKQKGFYVNNVEKLLEQAKIKLDERKNKEAEDLAKKIITIKEKAFGVNNLIKRIIVVLNNPREARILLGDVSQEFESQYSYSDLREKIRNETQVALTGNAIFNEPAINKQPINELLDLAILAFERGDYDLAGERANEARNLLLLEIKSNFVLFLILYWPVILLVIGLLSLSGIMGYKSYKKSNITRNIESLDDGEDSIRKLIRENQELYFSGKISAGVYESNMHQYNRRIAEIRKRRLNLRTKRVKMLKPMQVIQDLEIESLQIESEIKKLQKEYYKDNKINEKEYKSQFEILNERLSENEGERSTLELVKKREVEERLKDKSDEFLLKKNMGKEIKKDIEKNIPFLRKIFGYFRTRKELKRINEEGKIRQKVNQMLNKNQK